MFTFRLEPLITIRDNELKECQAELAKAYHARQIVEETRLKFERDIAESLQSARKMMESGTIDVTFLLTLQDHKTYRTAQLAKIAEDIKKIDEEIERRRAIVVAANKELKIVQKLKEKRYEKYLEEENKTEMKIMDEIAGNRTQGTGVRS
jgi:flagellar FliJ protein